MKKQEIIGIIVVIILAIGFAILMYFTFSSTNKMQNAYLECRDEYPLDSCEIFKCYAQNSLTTTNAAFNQRNYEICKIILNNNMTFNESLPLLRTITYDG